MFDYLSTMKITMETYAENQGPLFQESGPWFAAFWREPGATLDGPGATFIVMNFQELKKYEVKKL